MAQSLSGRLQPLRGLTTETARSLPGALDLEASAIAPHQPRPAADLTILHPVTLIGEFEGHPAKLATPRAGDLGALSTLVDQADLVDVVEPALVRAQRVTNPGKAITAASATIWISTNGTIPR